MQARRAVSLSFSFASHPARFASFDRASSAPVSGSGCDAAAGGSASSGGGSSGGGRSSSSSADFFRGVGGALRRGVPTLRVVVPPSGSWMPMHSSRLPGNSSFSHTPKRSRLSVYHAHTGTWSAVTIWRSVSRSSCTPELGG